MITIQQQPTAPPSPQAPLPPNTIVFPSDGDRPPVSINFDNGNIRFTQGSNTTSIPLKDMVPQGAVQMSYALAASVIAVFIGWPIARAIARYIDRRGRVARTDGALVQQLQQRFETLERNIDTVAVEMERLSEAQRFTSRLLAERQAVPVDARS